VHNAVKRLKRLLPSDTSSRRKNAPPQKRTCRSEWYVWSIGTMLATHARTWIDTWSSRHSFEPGVDGPPALWQWAVIRKSSIPFCYSGAEARRTFSGRRSRDHNPHTAKRGCQTGPALLGEDNPRRPRQFSMTSIFDVLDPDCQPHQGPSRSSSRLSNQYFVISSGPALSRFDKLLPIGPPAHGGGWVICSNLFNYKQRRIATNCWFYTERQRFTSAKEVVFLAFVCLSFSLWVG